MTDAIRHADARSALARLECWRAARDKLGECPYGIPAAFAADVVALLSLLEWRPISEAKRDETPRLLGFGRSDTPVIGFWSTWNGYWTDGTTDHWKDHVMLSPQPTRFLPLPPAPTEDKP